MSDTYPSAHVVQLAGPGVAGMEQDPPLFHYDVSPEEVPSLLADPVKFLKERGMGEEQGIAPGGKMTVTFTSNTWDGAQWVEESGGPELRHSCCYVTDAQSVCVPHSQPH
ncbi:hypothetical protein ACGFYP_12930 [Streptomyces sp. NPDC048370]|uniref:hypothetical protein n=1 Tax=Streptomyces sp. NPDC048370 TaxID=3365540 RepID=UPI003720D9AF